MKSLFGVIITVLTCSFAFAQSAEQLNDMALVNGCNDFRNSKGNKSTYLGIMQSTSQSREYKEAYDLGWRSCQSSSDFKVVNGKLVNVAKSKDKDRRPANGRGIIVWISKLIIEYE